MIRVASPVLLGNERKYINDCLDRVELTWNGSYVEKFERKFAEFCHTDYALACCNGTAALHLALLALGVKPGDRVIVPAMTYVATANAVRYCGAEPVFCDVDRHTWTLDLSSVERAWEEFENIVGMIPVHLYGTPAPMTGLRKLADERDMWIVEDAAEAHGAKSEGRVVGSLGDIGVFSFYGNKMITTGEGGMVVTNDANLALRMAMYRGQGVVPGPIASRYYHQVVGYNYRMTNLQAALGLAQLENFAEHLENRQSIEAFYRGALEISYEFQRVHAMDDSVPWMVSVLVPGGVNRDTVIQQMQHDGVETRPTFTPLPELPMYRGFVPLNSRLIGRRGINLPTHGAMSLDDAEHVIKTFINAVERLR